MKKIIALLIAMVMVMSLMAACGTAGDGGNGDNGGELAPIKIGCIQDTSGGASTAGQPNEWLSLIHI